MKTLLRRRSLAVLTGGALALGATVAVSPTASAASTDPPAQAAVGWLTSHLKDGVATYPQADYNDDWSAIIGYSSRPEYGVTIDVFLALAQLDLNAPTRSTILDGLARNATTYVAGFGSVSPAAAGKLATAVITGGRDPRAFGGRDLVADVEEATDATGETAGTYGGVGQAWATRALVLADSPEAPASLGFLLDQQCDDGSFPQDYGKACSGVDVDSTALAVAALSDAVAGGDQTVEDELVAAGRALAGAQGADGSFVGNDVPNSNSTGLAAVALSRGGRPAEAVKAARWIAARQVTDAGGAKLTGAVGAIAYDAPALADGVRFGIEPETHDQWIRASVQAAPALGLLAAPRAAVSVPKYARSGATVKVSVSGLAAGWRSSARVTGGPAAQAVASSAGRATFTVRVPKGTAKRTVSVSDRTGRVVASTTVQVLAAKKLRVTSPAKVRRGKTQRVVVRGLTAREPVRVYYRGKLVKRGVASSKGNFAYRVKVGKKAGKVKVVVRGAYADRQGVRTFRVVK